MVQMMLRPSQNPSISCLIKNIQTGLPFWDWLTQVVLEKRPLNGCSVAVVLPDNLDKLVPERYKHSEF